MCNKYLIMMYIKQLSNTLIRTHSHEKPAHSRKKIKPVKHAGWQGQQRVLRQINYPVARRNIELLRNIHVYIYIYMHPPTVEATGIFTATGRILFYNG
jgi:hypothetical protein